MLRRILTWLHENSLGIERFSVIAAALLALWPLGQWWSERDDRELSRKVNFIQTSFVCEELWFEHLDRRERLENLQRELDLDLGIEDWEGQRLNLAATCRDVVAQGVDRFASSMDRLERTMTVSPQPTNADGKGPQQQQQRGAAEKPQNSETAQKMERTSIGLDSLEQGMKKLNRLCSNYKSSGVVRNSQFACTLERCSISETTERTDDDCGPIGGDISCAGPITRRSQTETSFFLSDISAWSYVGLKDGEDASNVIEVSCRLGNCISDPGGDNAKQRYYFASAGCAAEFFELLGIEANQNQP